MNRWITHGLLAALLVLPFAAAHDPAGTPQTTCTGLTTTHDYGPVASGNLVFNPQDGNLAECGYTALFEDDQICGADPQVQALCDTDRTADWDGDFEYANGGGWVFSDSGDGATYGSLFCWDVVAHHGSSFTVTDAALGGNVQVTVTADWPRAAVAADLPCGDSSVEPCDPANPGDIDQVTCNALDGSVTCPAAGLGTLSITCAATFGPGSDGAYTLFIRGGTQGHIDG